MKFVFGLIVGVGAGLAASFVLANRDEEEGALGSLQVNVKSAIASAKAAVVQREKELWTEFHERVPAPDQTTIA
ncbi:MULTISPECIES: hypothetical protein [Herpetosiphon]|uniref:hypothetical protein n=1 Tax=Herpetosiphon TaxID=64 RepID=UPI00195A7DDA|nr:hypothetical protein [Herpetosiphon giganteus]MBM7843983.1 hypothetical protein [Herpetosiphon giganteus]